jgi:hypothetical protein
MYCRIPGSFILILSVFALNCSHKLAPEGHFQTNPVVADGNTDDWTIPLRFSNEKYTYQYNVTNDNKNIYICILSRDYSTQRRILKAGLTVYFDPKGDKNKTINLSFPLRKPDDQVSNYRNRNGNPITNTDTKSELSQLLIQSDYYSVSGFYNLENGQFGVSNDKNPIRVAIKLNNDSSLVYEAIIPLKNISPGLETRNSTRNFSVGIVLNSLASQPGNYNNSPRPAYGGGMRGMRGMYGGGRNNNSQNPGIKEEDTWYQFRLVSR